MRVAFFMLCLLAISMVGYGQLPSSQLMLYSITEQNGLSDNRVTCFFQDSRGTMWIGTEDGLNLYDGSIIKKFKSKKNDSTSIVNNYITAILEDSNHHLWISALNGLSEFDPKEKKFRNYQTSSPNGNACLMWGLQIDGQNLWIVSEVGLIQFIIPEKRFIIHYNQAHTDPSLRRNDNWLTNVLIDRQKRIWVATHNGLWRFYPSEEKFECISSFSESQEIVQLMEDHHGKIWMGLWANGLHVLDPETKKIEQIRDNAILGTIPGIAESKDEKGKCLIWISGLVAIDEKKNATKYSALNLERESNFSQSRFYFSNDGLLWISTPQGARILDPNRQSFFHQVITPNQITNQSISMMSKGDQLYVGGRGPEFLKLYDSAFHIVRNFKSANRLGDHAVINLVRENANYIWLCTEDGLALMDETTGEQKIFRLNEKEINTPARNFFTNMLIDSHGRHWVFPWRSGIWQLDVASGKFKKIALSFSGGKETEKKLVIACAVEDDAGNIWFADLDEGLILHEAASGKLSKPAEKLIGSFFNLPKIIYEKPFLWFAITGKVVRINSSTRKIDQWEVPEEFNKSLFDFCADNKRLWITTSSGLLSFDKKTFVFNRFTANDGLLDNEMNGVIAALSNGKIIYATENHVTEFRADDLLKSAVHPKVIITEVFSQNKILPIEQSDGAEKKMKLDYSYNNFTFHWALLNFRNPLQNQYYCKLDGIDKEWKYVGNTGQAEYASLPPGNYVFRARGTTSDGVKNIADDFLIITIQPPFWKTSWFVTLAIVLMGFIIYLIYRYRLNQILLQERMRSKISTDLHDDIGSTLSSISILGDLVLQKSNDASSTMVREIRDNAQLLMEKMDDIVWGINPDNDSLEKLLLRIKRFASQLFEAKNIEYSIDVQENIQQLKLPMEHRQHVYLILKESINNLAKHSRCTKATISVSLDHSYLHLTVTDNGKGFDANQMHHGNGIRSITKRAEAMRADLNFVSNSTGGSTIRLRVKIK